MFIIHTVLVFMAIGASLCTVTGSPMTIRNPTTSISRIQSDRQLWSSVDSTLTQTRDSGKPILKARVLGPVPLPNHWNLAVDSVRWLIPSEPAVVALENLFVALELHASTFQNQISGVPLLVFNLGDLELNFFSALKHIPWSLVQNVALLGQAMTERGFAGFFRARATHLSGITVFISLHLTGAIPPAN